MKLQRSSGILMHITSLPSGFGIGDIGPAAYEFIDFLQTSGHRFWQLLPINPTGAEYGHSPYSSFSAFAGNLLLISPELLEEDGFVNLKKIPLPEKISGTEVRFEAVETYKKTLLEAAFSDFQKSRNKRAFSIFCEKHSHWLDDFSLYQALTENYGEEWYTWPEDIRDREQKTLKTLTEEFAASIQREKFFQYIFFSQWERLLKYAHRKKVRIIGDLPFYMNHKSADCWAHPECFRLNAKKRPTKISGVPPDLFSEEGQLWGTPVYDWEYLQTTKFDWWIARLKQNLLLFDLVRLDHFRGFSAVWEVPAKEKTAVKGKWVKTPGEALFERIHEVFPEMPFIAEDLGSLDQGVYDLLETFQLPGMKVLQFAFGGLLADNPYIPFNHQQNGVVYTGTHDNDTAKGWYKSLGKWERRNIKEYTPHKVTAHNVHFALHRMALNSVAALAIIPLQDILGLGSSAKMNVPGTTRGNWIWRLPPDEIPWDRALELHHLNSLYGRI